MSNYTNAHKNLEQIINQLNTNNDGHGFMNDDKWSAEMLIHVTQIQATLAIHDAITAPRRKA